MKGPARQFHPRLQDRAGIDNAMLHAPASLALVKSCCGKVVAVIQSWNVYVRFVISGHCSRYHMEILASLLTVSTF